MVRFGTTDVHSEDDLQGDARPLPGRYHVAIKESRCLMKNAENKLVEVEEDDDSAEKIAIKFEVLAGTVPGQEGREISEFFALTEKAIVRLKRLALCVGLINPGEPEKEVRFSEAVARQLVIEIEENNYTNNSGQQVKGVRVAFLGMWSLGNEAASDVPKNAEAMKLAKQGPPKTAEEQFDGGSSTAASEGEAETAAAASAGSAGSSSKWDDL